MATRKGYEIIDIAQWCDLIRLLDRLGYDIRNRKYICPIDIKAAHDHYLAKFNEHERRARDKTEFERSKRDERQFNEQKSRYFGIKIEDSGISISVLNSIEAYHTEGELMHHCMVAHTTVDPKA